MNKLPNKSLILLRCLSILICLMIVWSPSRLGALSNDQIKALNSGVFYFNTEDSLSGCLNDNINLIGNDNVEKSWRYFIGKGFTPEQSAGIVGNFQAESGVNPEAFNSAGGGQGAYGIAQWRGGRQSRLKEKPNFNTLSVQLDYVWEELNSSESKAYEELVKETTARGAAISFDEWFERSGGGLLDERIANAENILQNYSTSTVAVGQSGALSCFGGNGEDTKYIDGFTVYSQYDPAWRDLPYSTSTIGEAGCGPAAMAMIITTIKGQRVTPVDTANYAASIGMYIDGVGSSWDIGPRLAENWGLRYDPLEKSVAAISSALRDGKLIVAPGAGAKPFTELGHFIVIRGITADGMFKVGDSAHPDANETEWDPEFIINNMRDGGTYAIYR